MKNHQKLNKNIDENLIDNLYKIVESIEDLNEKFESLSIETKRLEAIYLQKIADLEELKKSILQKAFNGELKTEKAAIA